MTPPRILPLLPLLLAAPAASGQTTTIQSEAPGGGSANGASMLPAISGDGRYVVFQSFATDLAPGDLNGCEDVFRRDLWTNALELVSVGLSGSTGNGPSRQSQVSGDGRYVLFQSYASDLVPGDHNGETDIFVRDMQLRSTLRISVSTGGAESNAGSRYGYISRDGRLATFESHASNLVPGDANGTKDVFVHDLQTGATWIESLAFDGSSADDDVLCSSISPDGRYLGFSSEATNLVPGDGNGAMDAFVRDTWTDTNVRVSTDASGKEGHGLSADVNVSGDGRFVAFYSDAPDLVPGDTNALGDVFVKDVWTGAIERVSVSSGGAQGDWDAYYPRISADGRRVIFYTSADTLVTPDTNWQPDVFLRDRLLGTTERVSLTAAGHEARGTTRFAALSDDGRFVVFESKAPNLDPPDDNNDWDIFVRDRVGWTQGFCSGDGSAGSACPCSNPGAAGRGCANGLDSAGAQLMASGVPAADDLLLVANGLSGMLALFLQGDLELPAPAVFGRGLRCIGGSLLRLYSAPVSGNAASAPAPGEPSIRNRSRELGDTLAPGATRAYQVWYRDNASGGCGSPLTNASNALRVHW
jgi:Tol biopolymer transport system component